MRFVPLRSVLRAGLSDEGCRIWGVMFLHASFIAYCLTTNGLGYNGIHWSQLSKWSKIGGCIF